MTFTAHELADWSFPAAIFDAEGQPIASNAPFDEAVASTGAQSASFQSLFGEHPTVFASQPQPPVRIGSAHYAVATRVDDAGHFQCQLADMTASVIAGAEAEARAIRDPLTGLFNRAFLIPELDRVIARRGGDAALILLDLDRFKEVNDTLGHAVGDLLLKKVSDRLLSVLRSNDSLVRLGGDEFALVQVGAQQPRGADKLSRRLLDLVARPYLVDGHMVDVGASAGMVVIDASSTSDPDTYLRQADVALYRAKETGRGRAVFFESAMGDAMADRRALEIDLRQALAFRQFELHYQPQIDVAGGKVTGCEALLRWNHPTRGRISPVAFIPLAEETGLIVPIGEWVIRQGCRDAAAWSEDIRLAVNVSAKQLMSDNLLPTIVSAVAHAGIAPERLDIELTESVLMQDTAACLATLRALKEFGTRVSMDDFGTGYSSLSHLRSFPFDTIKIDQSFVRNDDVDESRAIIRAIAAIGTHLKMETVAEGVETDEQLLQVTDCGCLTAQGYLISKPVPQGELQDVFARHLAKQDTPNPQENAMTDTDDLYRLSYYSRNNIDGAATTDAKQIEQILEAARRNNEQIGVTGALMFTDGFFAQVLEGERAAVERTFDRIQLDDRHGQVTLLGFEPVAERRFGEWSMAFVGADEAATERFAALLPEADGDAGPDDNELVSKLRALLQEEERFSVPAPVARRAA